MVVSPMRNEKYALQLLLWRIAEIIASYRKPRSWKSMATSDFRLEVEIYGHFAHAQWKIWVITLIIWTVHWVQSLWRERDRISYSVPRQKVFLVLEFIDLRLPHIQTTHWKGRTVKALSAFGREIDARDGINGRQRTAFISINSSQPWRLSLSVVESSDNMTISVAVCQSKTLV